MKQFRYGAHRHYRGHYGAMRNTSVNTLSLAGVCAYLLFGTANGFAGEPDALAISFNIQARHLPFGAMLDPMFATADGNQIVGYTRCGDSALWTGHYLAAEALLQSHSVARCVEQRPSGSRGNQ